MLYLHALWYTVGLGLGLENRKTLSEQSCWHLKRKTGLSSTTFQFPNLLNSKNGFVIQNCIKVMLT